jgi:hypothetical protein
MIRRQPIPHIRRKQKRLITQNRSITLGHQRILDKTRGQITPTRSHRHRHFETARKPRSAWSKSNVERVYRLIDAGRMRQAGQREIDAAEADGRWPTS